MPIALTPSPRLSPEPSERRRQILYVDAYDSFSNSIVGLLEQTLDAKVCTVRIDDSKAAQNLTTILKAFDAVVVGPGPGHPARPSDVGLIDQLWKLEDAHLLPIFGICLGFQSLSLAFGANVKRLRKARHGIVSEVQHKRMDIFKNVDELYATNYHSLQVDLKASTSVTTTSYWRPTSQCPTLQPLAWDLADELNGPILMSVRHTRKPFWGVQFHPESICTSSGGAELIRAWWMHAQSWLTVRHRIIVKDLWSSVRYITPIYQISTIRALDVRRRLDHNTVTSNLGQMIRQAFGNTQAHLQWCKYSTGNMSPIALVEGLNFAPEEVVVLDSQGHERGRYSILGMIIPKKTVMVKYNSWERILRFEVEEGDEQVAQVASIDELWPVLQDALNEFSPRFPRNRCSKRGQAAPTLPEDSPFWGGFMGYISYEAGLETIDVQLHPSCANSLIPDVNFAFIQRSIVMDHAKGEAYVQSLTPGDSTWITHVGRSIKALAKECHTFDESPPSHKERIDRKVLNLEKRLALARIETPEESQYRSRVLDCQTSLSAGDSYELCHTDETLITVPKLNNESLDPWTLYKKLRRKNPAPFGAFLQLGSATVVGTSPERFLNWTRTGHCQFRPIKGTVKKSPDITREAAHSILNSSKEQAENLMIVDLIRHDLSGVVGASHCSVSKLMQVEEYEHVYQLVSVIEGQLPGSTDSPTGLDVLKASLPPGSMTGAPKKRSCEILRDIEKRPRGIYSGVLGYLDVGGAGDFCVVIRTALRDADVTTATAPSPPLGSSSEPLEQLAASIKETETETWRIPAGGAVTIQSTDEGEFLEMETKVLSALGAFHSAQR